MRVDETLSAQRELSANTSAKTSARKGSARKRQPTRIFVKFVKIDRSYARNFWEGKLHGRTEYGKQTIASIRMPRGEANIYPSVRRCVNAL